MLAKPKRLVVLAADYPPALGGIQELLWQICRRFERVRPEVITLGARHGAPSTSDEDSRDVGNVVRVRPRSDWRHIQIAQLNARALGLLLQRPPAVVLSGHIVVAPAAAAVGRLRGVPFVQYLYGEEVAARPRLAGFAVRESARTISISSFTSSLVAPRARDKGRIVQIGCGVDLPGPGHVMPQPTVENAVLTVARLTDPYKGHDVMLRAWPRVLSVVPSAKWWIVGDGPLRPALEHDARAFGLSEHVVFFGAVDNHRRDELLQAAAVFAMPSRLASNGGGEGFGIVYLEAGAHSLPVLAGRVGGALDAVIDGETGLLVDPVNPEMVAEGIIRLLCDKSLAARLGREGRRQAELHSWAAVAERVEDLLLEVIDVHH